MGYIDSLLKLIQNNFVLLYLRGGGLISKFHRVFSRNL